MNAIHRFLLAENQLPVDTAIGLGHCNAVDLRTIEDIDAEDLRVRDSMIRYVSERE